MAVSYIDTHNAIYHPYIMRRRGSKNFGGDEAAATRRGRPAPRAPRRGGSAEGARRGGAAAIPSQTMELPSGTPPGEEPGGEGRAGGEEGGGAERGVF